MDFRACLGEIVWDGDQVTIDEVTALRLKLKVGDKLRCVEFEGLSNSRHIEKYRIRRTVMTRTELHINGNWTAGHGGRIGFQVPR